MTYRLPADKCPSCGKTLDAASSPVDKGAPDPGDISVCLGCHSILQFGEDLRLKALSDEDICKLPHEVLKDVAQIKEMLEWVKAKGG